MVSKTDVQTAVDGCVLQEAERFAEKRWSRILEWYSRPPSFTFQEGCALIREEFKDMLQEDDLFKYHYDQFKVMVKGSNVERQHEAVRMLQRVAVRVAMAWIRIAAMCYKVRLDVSCEKTRVEINENKQKEGKM